MKFLTTLTLFGLSLNAFAFEQSAKLNLTKLYGKLDAGEYVIDVTLKSKETPSLSKVTTSIERDDNDLTCTTTAGFELGEMTFTISQKDSNWKKVIKEKIFATATHSVPGTECDLSIENFIGPKKIYASMSLKNSPLTLPVVAPAGYEAVQVYLTPFSGYLYLDTTIELQNDVLMINPDQLLTSASIYPVNSENASKLFYYVQAKKGSSHLSLGNGYVDFN